MKPLLLLVLLIACGDNIPGAPVDAPVDAPSIIWRQAFTVWFDAWCSTEERCIPDRFHQTYADHAACVLSNQTNLQCAWCDDPYPDDRLGELALCHTAVLAESCNKRSFPDVCWEALQ